jgi:ribokinase
VRRDILVFGSLNVDFVVRTGVRPRPGETVHGVSFDLFPGGKGANQAVAASKAGGKVTMAGRIGDDVFAGILTKSLLEAGVRGDLVKVSPGIATGSAFITIDGNGENSIIVVAGANALSSCEDVDGFLAVLDSCGVMLLQLEVPLESVAYAAQKARERGVAVLLDPAPAAEIPDELITAVDYITPNEHEAAVLTGRSITDIKTARLAASDLISRGVRNAVVKLGGRGVVYATDTSVEHIPGHSVEAVDTTAAGDAFSGAFAVAISEGKSIGEACRFANAAGALAVTKAGAQTSMPWRVDIDRFLQPS